MEGGKGLGPRLIGCVLLVCGDMHKEDIRLYQKGVQQWLLDSLKRPNVADALEWSLIKADKPFRDYASNQVEGMKLNLKDLYEEMYTQLDTSLGVGGDILQTIWQFDKGMYELCQTVRMAAWVDLEEATQWKRERDQTAERGMWLKRQEKWLSDTVRVPDLWGDGYLEMIKEVGRKCRNILEDVGERVVKIANGRKHDELQVKVTDGIQKLHDTMAFNNRNRGGKGDSGGEGRGDRRGHGGERESRGGNQQGEGRKLPHGYVVGPLKEEGWCLHYVKHLLMGGGGGCMRGGKGVRDCIKGSHDVEYTKVKAHYNAWAIGAGVKPL